MAKEDYIIEQLLLMDSEDSKRLISDAWYEYVRHIGEIAEDIYDSCIADYYDQYEPTVYGRHGDIAGFNLYSANDIEYDEHEIGVSFEPSFLLPYAGKRDKRTAVLKNVMKGLRGGKSKKMPPGWPMYWDARYPNSFSKYDDWSSSGSTMNAIFQDFMANVIEETEYVFWDYVDQRL